MHKGYPVVSTASRTFESAKALARLAPGCVAYPDIQGAADAADFVFITTSDDAIRPVAENVQWREGQTVVHCSGAASLDVLEAVRKYEAIPGAFHPPADVLVSRGGRSKRSPARRSASRETSRPASSLAALAEELGGTPIFLRPEDKALYHATVVMAGGVLNTLIGAVAELWAQFGIERNDALKGPSRPSWRARRRRCSRTACPTPGPAPFVRG